MYPNISLMADARSAVGMPQANGVVLQQYNSTAYASADMRFKRLAFYDLLHTLLKPSTLLPNNNQRMQDATFYFQLTQQQATELAMNRDMRNPNKLEYVYQVQLRFCCLENTTEQDDYFPPSVSVKVNNKICQLPNPIPTNKPGVEAKRPPRPVNVTSFIKLSPTVPNAINVSWCTEFNRNFAVAVFLVKKLTSPQLLQRLKSKGIKGAEYTRTLIKEKLNEDADCEIATTMLRVSLICPLGKSRMSTPCRASTCNHLQCFDASLYLQMNERKPTWNCPVCDKPAVYENLVIDGYFQEVIASPELGSNDNEIQLHKDGSWSTHIMRNDTHTLDTPMKSTSKVEVISDDIELITESSAPMSHSNGGNPAGKDEPTSTTNESTVDLTNTDSEEEETPQRPSAAAPAAHNKKTNDCSIISLDSPSPPRSPRARPTIATPTSSLHDVANLC